MWLALTLCAATRTVDAKAHLVAAATRAQSANARSAVLLALDQLLASADGQPPPADPAAAAERIEERHRAYGEALERVGEAKASARESDRWDPTRGYKPFDEVQNAVRALALAKTAAYEAHLERAVALLCQAKGEPPASLDRFDWVYERGVEGDNARCLSFMLAALNKANASTGMCEVLWVANECGLVPALDAKIVKAAVAALGDLDDMGLLDEGEPETLAAVRDALDANDEG